MEQKVRERGVNIMHIEFTSEDIKYIYYQKLSLVIVLNHQINCVTEINLSFETSESLYNYLSELIGIYSLVVDDEYICKKFISKRYCKTLDEQ